MLARIAERAARYAVAEEALGRAVPASRFADFFDGQVVFARGTIDVVTAATEIPAGRHAEFAREQRGRLVGALRGVLRRLRDLGLPPLSVEGVYRADLAPMRGELARILSRAVEGTDADRLVLLAAVAAALRGHFFSVPAEMPPADPVAALARSEARRFMELVDVTFDALEAINLGYRPSTNGSGLPSSTFQTGGISRYVPLPSLT